MSAPQFQSAFDEGVRYAAQDLMDRLRDVGVRDDEWNGGDVVAVVAAWLAEHGIDMSVPEPEDADADPAFTEDDQGNWHRVPKAYGADEIEAPDPWEPI